MKRTTVLSSPARLPRSQSFFGIHFDFHAGPKDLNIGRRPIAPTLEELIRRVRPDYVQCDCKGHGGWSSYPTRVGHAVPHLHADTLKQWRAVTARHGVSLYMHYSGVFDAEAVKQHPAWARIDEKGKRDPNNTSVFGPYVDELMVPQLRELREVYGVDGYWVDGENWSTGPDYGKKVLQAFRHQTGIRTIPRQPGDPHFFEFAEFCREGFRRYLRHYVDKIHRLCPGVEVTSNWAFSSSMPEPVSASVDFISGDYTPNDSVNSARLEGRTLMHQKMPWDLMAWSFATVGDNSRQITKPAVQLLREAASVLALGGGFQAYFIQRRDGTIRAQHLGLMEELARFCRARQRVCHRAESVPQIALLHSTAAFYRLIPALFSAWRGERKPMAGVLNALLNNQYHVDIVSEHQVTGRMRDFALIVIPEWAHLDEPFRQELLAYARRGGKLLVIGTKTVPLFAAELGIQINGVAEEKKRWLAAGASLACVNGPGLKIKPGRTTRVLGRWHEWDDLESASHPVAVSRQLGRGEIAALAVDFGEAYYSRRSSQAREVMGSLVRHLFSRPLVTVTGSHEVDVVLMRKNGKLMVNLVNVSGPHDHPACFTFDEVTPLGPLTVEIRAAKRPKKIRLQPEGRTLAFRWSKGRATVTLPRLEIHSVLEVG